MARWTIIPKTSNILDTKALLTDTEAKFPKEKQNDMLWLQWSLMRNLLPIQEMCSKHNFKFPTLIMIRFGQFHQNPTALSSLYLNGYLKSLLNQIRENTKIENLENNTSNKLF